MRHTTFNEWMQEDGQKVYEDVIEWLENAPQEIDIIDLGVYDKDQYAFGICEITYGSNEDDYNDYQYEQYCDRTLDDE